jgi:RNA polymerase sigma-70 factor, ECF subfamily
MGLTGADANGRSQATEALYREHGAAVAGLCRSLLRDHGEAEDATQQVFLSAHRALLNGAVPREPLAWLLAVARNECYARFRERAVAPVPAADAPDATTTDISVQALRAEELADVWDEVGRMPPRQREAFLLREVRGLSYGQLADELSLSRPSVRSLLLRARTRLRRRLGDLAAGLGGAQWVQALLRLVAGGDGGSPAPAAAKAAAVGVGALVLAGGGGPVAHHASRTMAHTAARDHTRTRVHRAAAPAAVAAAPREDRTRLDDRATQLVRSPGEDRARESQSGRSGSRGGRDERGSSPHDGSDDTSAAAQPTTDGHDEGGSSSSGPGPGPSDESSSSGSGHDDAGSDGGTGPNTITTGSGSSGSDGSDSSGTGSSNDSGTTSHDHASDGGSSDGHGG